MTLPVSTVERMLAKCKTPDTFGNAEQQKIGWEPSITSSPTHAGRPEHRARPNHNLIHHLPLPLIRLPVLSNTTQPCAPTAGLPPATAAAQQADVCRQGLEPEVQDDKGQGHDEGGDDPPPVGEGKEQAVRAEEDGAEEGHGQRGHRGAVALDVHRYLDGEVAQAPVQLREGAPAPEGDGLGHAVGLLTHR